MFFLVIVHHARNYVVTLLDGRTFGDLVPESFDGVLVDAPCSCEGNARKDVFALFLGFKTIWWWTEGAVSWVSWAMGIHIPYQPSGGQLELRIEFPHDRRNHSFLQICRLGVTNIWKQELQSFCGSSRFRCCNSLLLDSDILGVVSLYDLDSKLFCPSGCVLACETKSSRRNSFSCCWVVGKHWNLVAT